MGGAEFHFIAKVRAQSLKPVLADRGLCSADYHNKIGCTADCQSQKSKFESRLPQG
jgi:hypothetical protein